VNIKTAINGTYGTPTATTDTMETTSTRPSFFIANGWNITGTDYVGPGYDWFATQIWDVALSESQLAELIADMFSDPTGISRASNLRHEWAAKNVNVSDLSIPDTGSVGGYLASTTGSPTLLTS